MVDLPNSMVDLPNTIVDLPNTMVDLPNTMVDLPITMVGLPNTMVDLPKTMTVLTGLLPFLTVFDSFWPFLTCFCPVLTILTFWTFLDRSWPFWTVLDLSWPFFKSRFWPYRHGLMVLTPPMVFSQTDGIVSVLLDHTHTKGLSVARMQDFFFTFLMKKPSWCNRIHWPITATKKYEVSGICGRRCFSWQISSNPFKHFYICKVSQPIHLI